MMRSWGFVKGGVKEQNWKYNVDSRFEVTSPEVHTDFYFTLETFDSMSRHTLRELRIYKRELFLHFTLPPLLQIPAVGVVCAVAVDGPCSQSRVAFPVTGSLAVPLGGALGLSHTQV